MHILPYIHTENVQALSYRLWKALLIPLCRVSHTTLPQAPGTPVYIPTREYLPH